MPFYGVMQNKKTMQGTGPTLTAAAAASILLGQAKPLVGPDDWQIGSEIHIEASGIISCAVTTPGTGRLDVRLGSAVVFDTAAFNLNVVAKASVAWKWVFDATIVSIGNGTLATLLGISQFTSEAVVGSPLPTVGGNGVLMLPTGGPAVSGTGWDSTTTNALDVFWTPSLATASFTAKKFKYWSEN